MEDGIDRTRHGLTLESGCSYDVAFSSPAINLVSLRCRVITFNTFVVNGQSDQIRLTDRCLDSIAALKKLDSVFAGRVDLEHAKFRLALSPFVQST